MNQTSHINTANKSELFSNGFSVIPNIYSTADIALIGNAISKADTSKPNFRKTAGLFAVRQFLKEIPATVPLIFTEKLKSLVLELFGTDYFVVKSIYFDKPEESNWAVSWHRDLTISVDKKLEMDGYSHWTVKEGQVGVQPPLTLLKNIFTIRIHLDDTDENNGALRVVPRSQAGIYRPETIDWETEKETVCKVKSGGVMIMSPLLLHSSSKTTNNSRRRVIHIEFSNMELPKGMKWAERMENKTNS